MSVGSVGSAGAGIYVRRDGTAPAASSLSAKPSTQDAGERAVQEFLDFAKMSPAEKIRYQYLQEHGLTEDDLKKMSPADREAVEEKIRAEIKEAAKHQTEKKTGVITDIRV